MGRPNLFITTETGYKMPIAADSVPRDTWVHLAGVYDGATARLYVNGAEVASAPLTGRFARDTTPVILGGNGNNESGVPTELFPAASTSSCFMPARWAPMRSASSPPARCSARRRARRRRGLSRARWRRTRGSWSRWRALYRPPGSLCFGCGPPEAERFERGRAAVRRDALVSERRRRIGPGGASGRLGRDPARAAGALAGDAEDDDRARCSARASRCFCGGERTSIQILQR